MEEQNELNLHLKLKVRSFLDNLYFCKCNNYYEKAEGLILKNHVHLTGITLQRV